MWPCETCEKPVPYGSELHYLAKEHVKQALSNLRGICIACSIELHSPSAVKLHLKQKKHVNKVKRGCHLSWSVDNGWSCGLCTLHFGKQLGWEVHLASSIHQDALGVERLTNLPRVEALVEYLSVVPTRPSNPEFRTLCNLCDESCEGLDEFVWHLLSKEHLQQLKVCMCPACKKYFSITEAASHLRSQTHLDALLKLRTSDGARGHGAVQDQLGNMCGGFASDEVQMRVDGTNFEGTSAADLKSHLWFSGGYEMLDSLELQGWWNCSHCLIACRSWHGLAVHARDKFHADNLPRGWTVPIQHGETKYLTYDSRMVACCKTPLQFKAKPSCSLPTASAWERWKGQRDAHSGWCHSCGIILNTPHLVEQHLVNHVSEQKQKNRLVIGSSGTITSTEAVCVEQEDQECAEIFQCRSCSVSFCNELGLTIHIALKQHRLRCSNVVELHENSGEWCESCGVTALHHGLSDTGVGLQDAKCLGQESGSCHRQEAVENDLEQIEVDRRAASPQEPVPQRFSSHCSEVQVAISTGLNPEFQLSIVSQIGRDHSYEASPSETRAPKKHDLQDDPSGSLICQVEAPVQLGPPKEESGPADGFSPNEMRFRTCGDSFCTRDGCCEVQPLLIEIPTSPGEDTGDTDSAPFDSPSSIAQRMLLSLAHNVATQGDCITALTPPIYETRDFMRASCAESVVMPKEGIDEESKNKLNSSDACMLSLSVSLPSKSMGPDLQSSDNAKKRHGADGNCFQKEFQGSKQIKFSEVPARDRFPELSA